MRFYIGLVHYPVYNKHYQKIASAITTFDLHDLSRLGKTYGAKGFFVITPLEDQQGLADRVIRHWREGYGAEYNPNRKEALELVKISPSIEASIGDITEVEGEPPLLITTDASRQHRHPMTFSKGYEILHSEKVVFLIFGTAWGLAQEVIEQSDFILDPIEGRTGYNHLSVRAAAAIILDRLTGSYR